MERNTVRWFGKRFEFFTAQLLLFVDKDRDNDLKSGALGIQSTQSGTLLKATRNGADYTGGRICNWS